MSMAERAVAIGRRLRAKSAARLLGLRTWLRRFLPSENQRLFALTLVLGAVCGLLAVAFHGAISGAERLLIHRALHAADQSWMIWTIVTPTVGGLVAGAALTFLVPGARGSGIPQVKQAFATEGGRVRFRDAAGKFIISAFQIGSGASLGREGPTVHICAGATSLLARLSALHPRSIRKLTPVGVAAGIAAAFNAPIAAVTFTIEEIVGTLDQTVLSGVVIAAALAAVIERGILGVHPVIQVSEAYGLDHVSSLPLFALLGVVAAGVSVLFTDSLLKLRLFFRHFTLLPTWMHPAVGGLVTGATAVGLLSWLGAGGVVGGGYETLGHALGGQLSLKVLLALACAKVVATVLSYSSGGAGGIFAPSLFIGAMIGGAVGHLDVALLGHESKQLGAFALVGMGAVFAGVIRAPITSVLIIFEMTGGYGLVLPLMLANMTSYVFARRLRPVPIYEALLRQDGVHLPEARHAQPTLDLLTVSDAMTQDVVHIHEQASVGDALLPVVAPDQRLVGVVPVTSLGQCDVSAPLNSLVQAASAVRSGELLMRAMVRMNDLGVRQLVAVDEEGRLAGMLSMSDVVRRHAPALGVAARRGGRSRAPTSVPEPCARDLMLRATMISGTERVRDLAATVRKQEGQAFVMLARDGEFGVILPERLDEIAQDEDLERMLLALDLVCPLQSASETDTLESLVRTFGASDEEAAVVLSNQGAVLGVVTRAQLAEAFLEWHIRRAA
jgi:chloride channel protein, CIC family